MDYLSKPSISSPTTWTFYYSKASFKSGEDKVQEIGPLSFHLFPEERQVETGQPVQATFRMEIWLDEDSSEKGDKVETAIWKMADSVIGKIISPEGEERRRGIEGRYAEWMSKKLEREEADRDTGNIRLFELRTKKPLRLLRKEDVWELRIKLAPDLPGTLQDQIARLTKHLWAPHVPKPWSNRKNLLSRMSRLPDLALKVDTSPVHTSPYLYTYTEELTEVSGRLEVLVEPNFELVAGDDSDAEEETRAQRSQQEVGLRRSQAPGPAEKKQRVDYSGRALLPRSGEHPDQVSNEDQEMIPADPRPTPAETSTPPEGFKIVEIPDCALSTLQAVIGYVMSGEIVFAPLSIASKQKRTEFIDNVREEDVPIPVSPRSVFRLAKRLGLEKLALIALEDMEAKLNDEAVGIARFDTAVTLAFHIDCLNYTQVRKLYHDFVRKNQGYVDDDLLAFRKTSRFQFTLLGMIYDDSSSSEALAAAVQDLTIAFGRPIR